jgi:pyrimidine-nucleoside phosphorylase
MRAVDIITRKRDGQELSADEIAFFIEGFTRGEIPDYQASAWAMAVLWRGMTPRETADLTEAMAATGDQLDLSDIVEVAVDKHSTGGVGDKTTLVVQPIVAGCGVPVGKMSGRGLGFTGGTLDKMESIPGYRVDLTTEQFLHQLKQVRIVLCGQTADLAPADGKLYALRDVSGTVPSIPLIASSVMSKKIASGAQAIVLDVKVGVGAFMHSEEEATELAEMMVEIGRHARRRTVALISDMNQPLGNAVGNALEVKEAIETLNGGGPADFRAHCVEVAAQMLALAIWDAKVEDARELTEAAIANGAGLAKFRELVQAQGGDVRVVDDPELLPKANVVETVPSTRAGYLDGINAREVGLTAMQLGAGRARKGDPVDYDVGVVVHRKVGDRVGMGDALFTVHARSSKDCDAAIERLLQAHTFSEARVDPQPHFYKIIGG